MSDCGCKIKNADSGNPRIVYCPTHKAAPKMKRVIKKLQKRIDTKGSLDPVLYQIIKEFD